MTASILIIEGDPTLRRELVSALSEANFTVEAVRGYIEAQMILDEFNPDMVIMDEVLPGRNGMEVCCQLHSTFGIPIILLGEDSSDEIWEKALVEAGADFYLRKPISHRELVARVKAILRRIRRVGSQ